MKARQPVFSNLSNQFLRGQGFVAQNLTSPYPVVELKSTGTTAVIVQKNMYKAVCLSSDSNLAIEVANSQLSLPG